MKDLQTSYDMHKLVLHTCECQRQTGWAEHGCLLAWCGCVAWAIQQLQQEMDARVAFQNFLVLTTEVKPVHPVLHCGVVAAALREAHKWLIRRIGAIMALLLRCSAGRGSGGRLRTTPLWLWLLPLLGLVGLWRATDFPSPQVDSTCGTTCDGQRWQQPAVLRNNKCMHTHESRGGVHHEE